MIDVEEYIYIRIYSLTKKVKQNYLLKKIKFIFTPKKALCAWYFKITGKVLNLDNPQTFNEKIQWLKLYDSTPIKTRLADKYLVRDWVKEKIGEEYLIPLLGVWDKFEDIDFDQLPDSFILKATHGCAWNIIVKDKSKFDKQAAKGKFNKWLKTNFAFQYGYEMHYRNICPRIIAEELICDGHDDLIDYKIWCFSGKAYYIQHLAERSKGLLMAFYNKDWQKQDFVYSHQLNTAQITKPDKLDEMVKLAEILSKDFPHVRVDFYITSANQIKFGEMTFTSFSGICNWNKSDIDLILGKLIKLPQKNRKTYKNKEIYN